MTTTYHKNLHLSATQLPPSIPAVFFSIGCFSINPYKMSDRFEGKTRQKNQMKCWVILPHSEYASEHF